MNNETNTEPAPVHQLVGRLRELLSRATPGPWEEVHASNRKHVCILEVSGGTPPGGQYSPPRRWKIVGKTLPHAPTDQDANAAIIVAAVNALPQLIRMARAGERIAMALHVLRTDIICRTVGTKVLRDCADAALEAWCEAAK